MPMNPSQSMLLLTYTPRADAASRGYDDWLRTVDNPFFNSQPGILRYTNWKIVDRRAGEIPFDYFDTMFIDPELGFEGIFGANEAVQRFADGWVELWGIDAAAGHAAVNYQTVATEVIAQPQGGRRTQRCLFLPNTPREDARERGYEDWLRTVDNPFFNSQPGIAGYTNFKVLEAKIGAVEFTDFDLVYIDEDRAFEDIFVRNPQAAEFAQGWVAQWGRAPEAQDMLDGVNFCACVAEVVAAPDEA